MFTQPDGPDAAAQLPPMAPNGPRPNGFFADCNPAAGFPGTRPMADHFNEQVLNNRALLARGRVTPVKGDPTMLWRAIVGLLTIPSSMTFNVALGGSPTPANPWGGEPFDSVGSALTFLAAYRIVPGAMVTIQVSTGVYGPSGVIPLTHPDGTSITIAGAGTGSTTLSFYADTPGIQVQNGLFMLRDLTLQGYRSGATTPTPWLWSGLSYVWTSGRLQNVIVDGFAGDGIDADGATLALMPGQIIVRNNQYDGINIGNFGVVRGYIGASPTILTAVNNGRINVLVAPGLLAADSVQTAGATTGVLIDGPAYLIPRLLGVDRCTNPAAVQVTSKGSIVAPTPGAPAGNWWTWDVGGNHPQYFYATGFGYIAAMGGLATNNITNTNPALNIVGNIQAVITNS